ncbi:MAG TPA: TRAM domain-containing protein [Bacillota bacterium]
MSSRLVRTVFGCIGVVGGAAAVHYLVRPVLEVFPFVNAWVSLFALVFIPLVIGVILYILAPSIVHSVAQLTAWLEGRLIRVPLPDIVVGSLGLIIGLVIAALFGGSLARIPIVGSVLAIVASALFGYLGWTVAIKKRDDILGLLPPMRGLVDGRRPVTSGRTIPKLLDTSTIIDGRIADIYAAGFVEGPLLIPQFVLDELRHIADSSDPLKRNRGRRGLDVLNRLQKELGAEVTFLPDDGEQGEVDTRLVKQAKALGARILTNDFNLNKVAELQGVSVLNINDLANALKPIVLPGETVHVQIIREGKEPGQGVGYFDDGTMIVVETGRQYIGETVEVTVTSVLQTSAGRMIFARPKEVVQRVV